MSEDSNGCQSTHCKSCPAWANSVFRNLNDQDLDLLQQKKSQRNYERGEAFSIKGQPTDEIYCLGLGSAKVTLLDENTGRQSLVRLAAPSDLLGYRCIFSAPSFRGTATALTTSTACKVPKSFVFDLIEREPKFSFEMLARMGREVAAAEYHLHSFCQKNVRERLAEALLILKDKFGVETPAGWKINTRLTRSELSNWVGASRETVIRELTAFTQESLVDLIGGYTYLKNLGELTKISGTRPVMKSEPQLVSIELAT
jgi:CRP-like cAMP-binding protein